ncbi:hypothetical protein SKAU_G00408060 [Synaphobranchus kaupii]|uniref:Uncharacterized protein n=1 Tax=Synaphobranchus kaupii TaxID=118154 RepID=A0A9Q1EAH9_SYNKA|nr:hypothetical protein SKAU_G00408060 [Synaphobranchus kaupii]
MFIPAELRAKYISIDCLEGLTWSMFFEENEKSRAPDYVLEQSLTLVWLAGRKPVGDLPIKHIVTILDLVREIRYVAKENVNFDLYYVLNDCVYKVQNRTLHVSIAGKCEGSGDGICERWGRYLMAAVFSESVRNFRTFSLFLMSVIACEDLAREGQATAFMGAALARRDERTKHDKLDWLELVLHKENFLFARTKARMTSVYGQRDDAELDIFGKVKVVNPVHLRLLHRVLQGEPRRGGNCPGGACPLLGMLMPETQLPAVYDSHTVYQNGNLNSKRLFG